MYVNYVLLLLGASKVTFIQDTSMLSMFTYVCSISRAFPPFEKPLNSIRSYLGFKYPREVDCNTNDSTFKYNEINVYS